MMERYEKYKPSGVEWLGEVPANWEVVPIKYSLETKLTDGPHETPNFLPDGIPFISAEAIKNERIDFDKKRGFISIEDHERYSKKYKPRRSDIYMIKSGATTGNVAIVETDREFNIWSPLAAFRSDRRSTKPRFLFHYLKSGVFFKAIQLGWNYGTQQNIGMGVLENLAIPRPPLSEQTAIARYLDRKTAELDELIADKRRLLDLYSAEKTALINRLCTRGRATNTEMKDSGVDWLGEVPADWDVTRLRYLGNCQNGIGIAGDAFGSGYPFVSYSDVYNNAVIPDQVKGLVESSDKDRDKYSVKKGDVFFTRTSETVEEIAYAATCLNTIENATYAGFVIRWRPDDDRLHDGFKKHYFRAKVHRRFFVKEMNLVTRASLSQELLKRLPVLLPPWEEQVEIAKYLDSEIDRIDSLVTDTHHLITLLTEYRTTLISEAVTGQIKIPLES